MEIAIDFDGTCTSHDFPNIGNDIGAAPILKKLVENGHNLILWTMRCDHVEEPITNSIDIVPIMGNHLSNAIDWFVKNNIPLYGIQTNPSQCTWTSSPKCYAHFYIDDAAIGCPLIYPDKGKPYVDWKCMEKMLIVKGLIKD